MLYFNIFRRWRNVVGLMAFFLLFPVDAKTAVDHFHPDMLSYSMQIASLSDREKAVSYYQDLEQKLPDDLVDELRLEFIDPYYSLRMGFEKKESTLQGLAEKVQPFFPQAILIRCALIQERIIMASARVNEIHESKLSVTSDAPEYQKQPARAISDLDFAQADNHGQLPAQTSSTLSADDFFMAELYRARDDLTRRKRPYAGLLGGYFTDKNDLSVMHGGAFGRVVVFDGLDFTARVMTGMISQSSDGQRPRTRLRRSSFMLGINDYFLTPELIVWASAMLESFNMRDHGNAPEGSRLGLDKDYVAGGHIGGKYVFEGGSELGIEGSRQSIWAEHDLTNPRLFNRITDLSQMHPDLILNQFSAFADLVTRPEHRLRAEAGFADYSDNNSRVWGYAHYQLPFPGSRDARWAVIRPNIYLERVRKDNEAYFSPRSHVTAGIMLHAIHQYERFEVEAEINPQLLWTKDEDKDRSTEAGIHGLLRISFFVTDDLSLGLSGFGYADTDDYWLARGIMFVRYVF